MARGLCSDLPHVYGMLNVNDLCALSIVLSGSSNRCYIRTIVANDLIACVQWKQVCRLPNRLMSRL